MAILAVPLVLLRLLQLGLAGDTQASTPTANLTGPWELFVDDEHIQNMTDSVRRRYHQFTKHTSNPVLTGARLYGTVLPTQDGHGFSMWHQCIATFGNCYANSTDGIHWTRPALGLIEGSADASMVLTRVDSTATSNTVCTAVKSLTKHSKKTTCRDTQPSVIHTPHVTGSEYQMFNFNYGQDIDTKCPSGVACDKDGYYRAVSRDGIHFEDDPHNPILATDPPHSRGDVSSFVYDYHANGYLATIKMFFAVNTTANYSAMRRSVGVSTTRDPSYWQQPIEALTADAIDDRWATSAAARSQQNRTELYGLSAFAYQSQYVGLLWVAHFNAENDGTIEVELVSSRDGKQWKRAEPQADGVRPNLIPRGPAAWDGMMVHTSTHPLLINDTLHLYYQGDSCSHHRGVCLNAATGAGPAVGLATLRRDGFVSLSHGSGLTPGVVLIRAVEVTTGATIRVNFATEASGTLRVALINPATGEPHAGHSIDECTPLHGDSTSATVTWANAVELKGPLTIRVQIQFHMEGVVELYSYVIS